MADHSLHSILEQMTLEEKIAQLMQLATPFFEGAEEQGEITGPMAEMGITEEIVRNSGSVLGASGAKEVRNIQEAYLKHNRLGIPLLIMADIVHGFKTIFPVPLGIGCSWDMELAEKSAEIAAKEASVSGVHVTFAPMVDLVRDPRWGRVMESTGEDPFLNSEFARAFVRGFQGRNLSEDTDRVAACVKHFAAYGAAEGGRDYNTVDMSERQLRETYFPAYKAALDEGCEMVMTAFNTVDGIPASGNKKLMRDILRDEWGFEGILISDWGAVKELIPHGVASGEKEAAEKALKAGVDIEMMTTCYVHHLKELVESGSVSEDYIDEAVLRILTLKKKLGLFEHPHRGADEKREQELIMSEEHRDAARRLAAKSCVLLKNDNILPLQADKKVALIGPFAKHGDILGPWAWKGSREKAVQLYEGMVKRAGSLSVAKGCDVATGTEEELEEALAVAAEADIVILALGESSEMSGEAGSRSDIRLPEIQRKLLAAISKLDKPTVAVLFNGRPLDLTEVSQQADAILEAWFPGTEGGHAITDLLYGIENPSGKLTMSFPHSVGQVPVYYNCFNTGRPQGAPDAQERYVSQYLDIPNEALYPFGYGLSYSSFTYDEPVLSSTTFKVGETINVTVRIHNTSEREGEETVQLYVRDLSGEVVRPLKELKDFAKLTFKPHETKEVTFTLKEEQLRYHHSDLQFTSDPGEFIVYVGPNSAELREQPFKLVK
ncbi:glycoside hydrolase family 3 N-terminal domain-containing protein [Fictibacillus enclensis]|uniref:glycoside hydrolase family 3 N-terminal domain-containing protein n=1 Tax=Fictibacillus enclensis TaxID=1017270 RepID=UPI0025A06467|nr:glycoside hydrolase family 3 N-terminal domain-containing protein [Fictibacillus enclensis]MDM5337523.1 glycoside hydrolase family 3 N-terminal domain-containing protein [Fictibacillus enclensis]